MYAGDEYSLFCHENSAIIILGVGQNQGNSYQQGLDREQFDLS